MLFLAHAASFAVALVLDASGLLTLPVLGRPILFAALAACVAVRSSALAGGAWGFAGGLALGLLFSDNAIGARVLGGLLAGSLPVLLKRVLYLHRTTGQLAVGAVAGLGYGAAGLLGAWVQGSPAGGTAAVLPGLLRGTLLTAAVTPLLYRLLVRLERQV